MKQAVRQTRKLNQNVNPIYAATNTRASKCFGCVGMSQNNRLPPTSTTNVICIPWFVCAWICVHVCACKHINSNVSTDIEMGMEWNGIDSVLLAFNVNFVHVCRDRRWYAARVYTIVHWNETQVSISLEILWFQIE